MIIITNFAILLHNPELRCTHLEMSGFLKQLFDFNGRKNIFTNICNFLYKNSETTIVENVQVVSVI